MEKLHTAACAGELATSYRGPIRESRSISANMQSASTDLLCAGQCAEQVAKHVAQRPESLVPLFFSLLLQFTSCDGHLGSFRLDNVVR
jgi:hypothetical protein